MVVGQVTEDITLYRSPTASPLPTPIQTITSNSRDADACGLPDGVVNQSVVQ